MKKSKFSFKTIKTFMTIGDFFANKEVKLWEKIKISIVIALSLIYFFIPIDIIPDVFFGLGWLEDVAIIIAMVIYVSERISKAQKKQKDDVVNNIIDVDFVEVKPK